MFFPRLRSQAKWAFVFLILVFAGGFVFLGVGSGGLDLGALIRDAFGTKGPSTGSLSQARKDVQQRPYNAIARRHLAQLLENKGRVDEAIAAWSAYTRLRPKDVDSLRHLGDLQLGQANNDFRDAQLAAIAQQEAGVGSPFRPSTSAKFGQALGQDPISAALTSRASTRFQELRIKYQTAAIEAVSTYQRIVKVRPKDEQALFSLAQAADALHQNAVAVSAYKRLLTFNLEPSQKAQIRDRIKTLKQSSGTPGG